MINELNYTNKQEVPDIYKEVPTNFIDEVKIITKGDVGLIDKIQSIYQSPISYKNYGHALEILKDELRNSSQGRGKTSYIALEKAFLIKDTNKLITELQELYLNYIMPSDIEYMYMYITDTDKLKKLYLYAENKATFLSSILECLY